MPDSNPTLLELVRERFGVTVDPDSDGGQILNLLISAITALFGGAVLSRLIVAGLLAAEPTRLVKTARNCLPLCAA